MKHIATLLFPVLLLLASPIPAQEIVRISPPADTTATADMHKTLSGKPAPADYVKTGEVSIQNPETGQRETETVYGPPQKTIYDLYMEGDYRWMSIITLCLIAMLFAAWKAPRWIKELGQLALVIGIFYMFQGFYSVANLIHTEDLEIGGALLSQSTFFGALRVALIAPMYGLIVYGISLILRIALKPRI